MARTSLGAQRRKRPTWTMGYTVSNLSDVELRRAQGQLIEAHMNEVPFHPGSWIDRTLLFVNLEVDHRYQD